LKKLVQKLLQRWRRCGETGAHACGHARRCHGKGCGTRAPAGRALGRRGRRTAMPPNPRAVCGETSGGAGDGRGVVPLHGSGRRRGGNARGAVRRRTRRRVERPPGGDDVQCAANGLAVGPHPQHWLSAFLQACAEHGGQSPRDLSAFLPWQMAPERRAELARPVIATLPPIARHTPDGSEPEAGDTS
jgi:hypothetical protein